MAVKIKRGDRRPGVTITCSNGSQAANLTLASSLKLIGRIGATTVINRTVTGDAQGRIVIDPWEAGDTQIAGLLQLEVQAIWADGTPQTFPGGGYLEVQIVPDLGD